MNLNDATTELVRLRDHIATRPPSPKGKQVFEAIQTVLREIEQLRLANKLLHDATIVLRNGMGGHNHWDHTMERGAGCTVCILQRQARAEATNLIEQAAEAGDG